MEGGDEVTPERIKELRTRRPWSVGPMDFADRILLTVSERDELLDALERAEKDRTAFCRVLGDENVVSAMANLLDMKKALTERGAHRA
jgi:NTP pyrophosphatase (non-canonical NTP hydrolase)